VEPAERLLPIAKLLLSEDDDSRAPEILLRHVVEATEADRGFIVVREGATFEQKFDVAFDRSAVTSHERRFSRSLVRQAIDARRVIDSPNLAADPRFAEKESIAALGACAVIAAPLVHGGEVHGVLYLEHRRSARGFSEEARRFLAELVDLAGGFLRRALERDALRRRTQALERDLFARHDFSGIVTRHAGMVELLRTVAQVADSTATVLVRGETGTGKELIARALHVNSPRRKKPFVTLHTTALPATVLESELFGHQKGAFTGADRDRPGRIAGADGGTLFLDEIGEIPLEAQAKLLRFLQFGEIQRLGSDRTQTVDVRVVAATHQDLPALVQAGRFRQDLYFRLKVIELFVPPLRDRTGDVPLLVDHFLRTYWRREGDPPRWTRAAEQALASYAYPGNVRELAHAVERACILARGPDLGVELLPPEIAAAVSGPPAAAAGAFAEHTAAELEAAKEAAVARVEDEFLAGLMDRCGGNVSQAARHSGIHRSQLQRIMARRRA
jgi:Nif-specific regulatory protein/two-component system response regulator HydG